MALVLLPSSAAASPSPTANSTVAVAAPEAAKAVDALAELAPDCSEGGDTVQSGLTNIGFETGTMEGWKFATVTEEICVTGEDEFASPFEGNYMARIGSSQTSSGPQQTLGPNEFSQTFTVVDPVEQFVYEIFTYDYTGFDDFRYQIRLTDSNGATIASYQRGAWGSGGDVTLKSSGWQYVELDLSNHTGEEVTISFSAGGTEDDLYAFWVYLDSAESGPPPPVAQLTAATAASGSITTDQQTGQVTVSMPSTGPSDLMLTSEVTCPSGTATPTVAVLVGGILVPMVQSSLNVSSYHATVGAGNMAAGLRAPGVLIPSSARAAGALGPNRPR